MGTTEIATVEKAGLPADLAAYGDYAGAGFEGTTAADFKPSFLKVLQGTSPQLDNVNGAKPGLIIDTVTNDLYPEVLVIPAHREHVYAAWKPRDPNGSNGGAGFGGIFQLNDPTVVEALKHVKKFERGDDGKIKLPEFENDEGLFQLVETVYFHCVQRLPDGGIVPVTVPFSSTGMGVASDWFSTMGRQVFPGTSRQLPLFAHAWKLGVQKTERGTLRWYNFAPSWANGTAADSRIAPDSELFKAGVSIYEAFKSGSVDVDYAQAGASDGGAKGSEAEVPF